TRRAQFDDARGSGRCAPLVAALLHVFLKWSEYPDAFLCLHASAYSGHWQAEWIVLGRELELGRVQCGKQPLKVRYQEGYDHEYYIVSP
ncbi:hypothetical protein DXM13_06920, partial [Fructilactobacillus sanfranciscensis]